MYWEFQGEVDLEWVQLIREAIEIGISKEEVLEFLQKQDSGLIK